MKLNKQFNLGIVHTGMFADKDAIDIKGHLRVQAWNNIFSKSCVVFIIRLQNIYFVQVIHVS